MSADPGITKEKAIAWLEEAARYFAKQAAEAKEDMSFWAASSNAETAKKIAALLSQDER